MQKELIVVDVEADGPCPGIYSMVCFGAVVVDKCLDKTFYGQTAPLMTPETFWNPEALAVSGFTREQHEAFPDPAETMVKFKEWLEWLGPRRLVFISDNPAFDWQFINYYFHKYLGENPFGFSARRIGDLYCGLRRHMGKNNEWKKRLRKTAHTHHPVQDCLGNAEALLAMSEEIHGIIGD